MHFGLTEEQEMIVSTVRSFVENEIYPHETTVERLGYVPEEIGDEIKRKTIELGFYASNFPNRRVAPDFPIWSSRWWSASWDAGRWRSPIFSDARKIS